MASIQGVNQGLVQSWKEGQIDFDCPCNINYKPYDLQPNLWSHIDNLFHPCSCFKISQSFHHKLSLAWFLQPLQPFKAVWQLSTHSEVQFSSFGYSIGKCQRRFLFIYNKCQRRLKVQFMSTLVMSFMLFWALVARDSYTKDTPPILFRYRSSKK